MPYVTNTVKKFTGKGFVEGDTFTSTGKKDREKEYSIEEIFNKIGNKGKYELSFSVEIKEVAETVEEA